MLLLIMLIIVISSWLVVDQSKYCRATYFLFNLLFSAVIFSSFLLLFTFHFFPYGLGGQLLSTPDNSFNLLPFA